MREVTNEEFNKALVNKDLRGIIGAVKKKYKKYIPYEELNSCCMIALWDALRRFEPEKDGKPRKLTTYLYMLVNWECIKWIHNDKIARKHKSKEKELDETASYSQSMYNELSDILQGVPQQLALVIEQKYLYNMTYEEIGKKNKYSGQTAQNRLNDGLKYIKHARIMHSE